MKKRETNIIRTKTKLLSKRRGKRRKSKKMKNKKRDKASNRNKKNTGNKSKTKKRLKVIFKPTFARRKK